VGHPEIGEDDPFPYSWIVSDVVFAKPLLHSGEYRTEPEAEHAGGGADA
jgi:hypothetical protein